MLLAGTKGYCVIILKKDFATTEKVNFERMYKLHSTKSCHFNQKLLQACLWDIADSVPDHHNKAYIAMRQVTWFFFLVFQV